MYIFIGNFHHNEYIRIFSSNTIALFFVAFAVENLTEIDKTVRVQVPCEADTVAVEYNVQVTGERARLTCYYVSFYCSSSSFPLVFGDFVSSIIELSLM